MSNVNGDVAQAMSDRESGLCELNSAASLSGASLATGISQQQQLSRTGEQREEREASGGEGREEEEGGRGKLKEVGGRGNERQEMCGVPEPRPGCEVSGKPPSTSASEDEAQCLLKNIPRIKEEFEVLSKIGEGTFSSVYLAGLKGRVEMQFALKHLVPTSASSRIENELKCLQTMGGRDNVIPLLTCVRHRDHVVLIMPYFPHSRFTDYLHMMTPSEVQCYMRALFTALCNVHSHHVIHRDIKPSNFLYNRDARRFQLVDFGLAHLEPDRAAVTNSSSFSSSRTQTAHPKGRLRASRTSAHPSLSTPPTSSSAHVTKAPITAGTSTRHHPQVHINGTGLIPPHTYSRQVHGRVQSQATLAIQRDRERGKGRGGMVTMGRTGRRIGEKRKLEEGGERSGESSEGGVCPLRHKKTELCDVCQSRSHQNAPRAGTPGFRAPEVLLKYPHQTTAVDVWSAGVIFVCLLSGRYPFFRATDDLSALAQVIGLMGTTECTRVVKELGKELVCGQQIEPVDLRELCRTLRRMLHTHLQQQHKHQQSSRSCNKHPTDIPQPVSVCSNMNVLEVTKSWQSLPDSAYDLLYRCLEMNPAKRVTALDALQHPFLADVR